MAIKLPPLSFAVHEGIGEIENFANQTMLIVLTAGGEDSGKVLRALRTCAEGMFNLYMTHYISLGHKGVDTIIQVREEVSDAIGMMFKMMVPKEQGQQEAREVIDLAIRSAMKQQPSAANVKSVVVDSVGTMKTMPPSERHVPEMTPVVKTNTKSLSATAIQIESFIAKILASGTKIEKRDIWTVAGYKEATEFERFQRDSPRTTKSARRTFNEILGLTPNEFLRRLALKRKR